MLLLKSERIEKGLTITELSFRVQIHPATLGKIESKKMIAYEPHKKKLSKFFGIPPEELFQEINQNNTEGGL